MDSPLAIATTVTSWAKRSERLKVLMTEYERFDYGPVNLPVHLMFSHFMGSVRTSLPDRSFSVGLAHGWRANVCHLKSKTCFIATRRYSWTSPMMAESTRALCPESKRRLFRKSLRDSTP